jgi:hypothetical protein
MSAATLTPPPAAGSNAGPQPHRWTVAEYRELAKTGLFHDKKTMLLDGVLYVMVMPNPPHDTALGLTEEWLRSVFVTGDIVRGQMGFDIGTEKRPGPDLAVFRVSVRDYATRTTRAVELIAEEDCPVSSQG